MTLSNYSNKIILHFDPIDWGERIPQQILSLFRSLGKTIEKTKTTYQIDSSDRYLVEKYLPKMWFTEEEWQEGERALAKFLRQFDFDRVSLL